MSVPAHLRDQTGVQGSAATKAEQATNYYDIHLPTRECSRKVAGVRGDGTRGGCASATTPESCKTMDSAW